MMISVSIFTLSIIFMVAFLIGIYLGFKYPRIY